MQGCGECLGALLWRSLLRSWVKAVTKCGWGRLLWRRELWWAQLHVATGQTSMWTETWKTGSTESVQEAGGTFDPHCCISLAPLAPFWSSLRQRRTRSAIIFPSVIFLIMVQPPWAPQQWSCLCCDVPSFIFLPSPFNVQSSQWQVDYKVPEFWSNQHDKPSLRGLRGGPTRFHVLMNETNALLSSRYVEQTAWLMCLFGVSQSLMAELPHIRPPLPFCCQDGASSTQNSAVWCINP